jgi:hypothetical protein
VHVRLGHGGGAPGVGRRWIRGALALASLAASLAFAGEAGAYCRTTTCAPGDDACTTDESGCSRGGVPLTWRTLPIEYRFSSLGSSKLDSRAARVAVQRAFDTWSSVTCDGERTSLRFVQGPDIRGGKPEGATRAREPFGIYFRDESWGHDDDDESLALTNQLFGELTGKIEYSDIEINTFENVFALDDARAGDQAPQDGAGVAASTEGVDLQAVVTHEVGHYIGLAHSHVPDSIMVARYCQSGARCGGSDEVMRGLADDDVSAVCALYPPRGIAGVRFEDTKDPLTENRGCSVSASAPGLRGASGRSDRGSAPIAVALVALCVAGAAARRRPSAVRRILVFKGNSGLRSFERCAPTATPGERWESARAVGARAWSRPSSERPSRRSPASGTEPCASRTSPRAPA